MHSVIVLADHHLSHAAMSETSHPPIGPYSRAPVEIHETDPPDPPMLWGVLRYGSTDYRVHVHVVLNSSPEVVAMRGFRWASWVCRAGAASTKTTRPGQPQPLAIDRGRRCLTGVALPAATARPGRSGSPRLDLGCKSRLDHRPGSHVTSEGLLNTQGPTGFRQEARPEMSGKQAMLMRRSDVGVGLKP